MLLPHSRLFNLWWFSKCNENSSGIIWSMSIGTVIVQHGMVAVTPAPARAPSFMARTGLGHMTLTDHLDSRPCSL